MLRSSSNRGNWCCLKSYMYLNLQLTLGFWWCTTRTGESDAYWESPSQTGRLGRSVYSEVTHFFLHCFATWESLFWRSIFSESEILWTFFGFSWACNIVYDIGYESEINDIEIKLKFALKGASNNNKSLHFVQWCISKAVLWPPILICARYLLCNSAGGLGALWAPSGSRAKLWWGPEAKPWKLWKHSTTKGLKSHSLGRFCS